MVKFECSNGGCFLPSRSVTSAHRLRIVKSLIKAVLARTPYRLVRRKQVNRFAGVEEALASMKSRGFAPDAVIDGGANMGNFSEFALGLFPGTIVHAIEPQPGCQEALDRLQARSSGRLMVHPVALCSPEHEGATLTLATDESATSTGAHVSQNSTSGRTVDVPSITLDTLLAQSLRPGGRVLLKLDLQGYELHALRGAITTLEYCEAVLTEVSFYTQAYEPPISSIVALLAEKGFELYDIAAIYARPRDDRPRQGDMIFARLGSSIAADTNWS